MLCTSAVTLSCLLVLVKSLSGGVFLTMSLNVRRLNWSSISDITVVDTGRFHWPGVGLVTFVFHSEVSWVFLAEGVSTHRGTLKYGVAVKPVIMISLTEPVIYQGAEYSNASVTAWKNEGYFTLRPLRAAFFNGCCCDLGVGLLSGQGMDVIFTPSLTAYIVYDIGFYLFHLRRRGSEALCPLFFDYSARLCSTMLGSSESCCWSSHSHVKCKKRLINGLHESSDFILHLSVSCVYRSVLWGGSKQRCPDLPHPSLQ